MKTQIRLAYSKKLKEFILHYLLMLLIPIAIGIFSFLRIEGMVKEQALESNTAFVKQFSTTVDQNVRDIEQFATFVISNETVKNIGSINSLDTGNILNVTELTKQMLAYSISNERITDYFIFFPRSNFIYAPTATYDTELFFDRRYYTREGYGSFKQELGSYYTGSFLSQPIYDYPNGKSYLVYAKSLSGYAIDSITANVFILFDISMLTEIFSSYADAGVIEQYMILDTDGNFIYGQGDTITDKKLLAHIVNSQSPYIENENFIISKSLSNAAKSWYFLALTSTKTVFAPVIRIRSESILLFLLFILLSIILALFLSIKSYQPIYALLSQVEPIINRFNDPAQRSKSSMKNDLVRIERALKRIADDNQSATERIEAMMPVARNNVLLSLLKGDRHEMEEEDIKKTLQSYGVYFQYEYFTVIVVEKPVNSTHGMKESGIAFYACTAEIARRLIASYGMCICIELSSGYPCIILNTSTEFLHDKIFNFAKELVEIIAAEHKLRALAFTGGCYKDIEGMCQSFKEADIALNYRSVMVHDTIVEYRNIIHTNSTIEFSANKQIRLENSIRAGNLTECISILEHIFNDNFILRTIAPNMASCLMSAIFIILMRSAESVGININGHSCMNNLPSFDENIEYSYQWLKELCLFICDKVNSSTETKKDVLKEKIIAIIDENLTNPSLNQSYIASKVGITASYLSCLFKDLFNMGMSEYITKKRCSLAATYLKDCNLTLDNISEKVGLLNSITLNRIFKKYYGVTPGQYRNYNTRNKG